MMFILQVLITTGTIPPLQLQLSLVFNDFTGVLLIGESL